MDSKVYSNQNNNYKLGGNNKRNTFKDKKGYLMEKDNQYKELTEDDLNSFEDGEWKL